MKKNTVAGLIAIVAIVAMVIFAGCVEEETQSRISPEMQVQKLLDNSCKNLDLYSVKYQDGYIVAGSDIWVWYVESGEVYAVNGMAKSCTPQVQYHPEIDYSDVDDLLRK